MTYKRLRSISQVSPSIIKEQMKHRTSTKESYKMKEHRLKKFRIVTNIYQKYVSLKPINVEKVD